MPFTFSPKIISYLGISLFLVALTPAAFAVEMVSQAPLPLCSEPPNNGVEMSIRQWLERSRTLTQTGRPDSGAQVAIRALQLTQRSPDQRLKADILRSITEDSPTGILRELVNRSIALKQPEAARAVLPVILQIAQALPSGYSSAKTQAMIAVAQSYQLLNQPQQAANLLPQALQAANLLRGAEFQAKAFTAIAQEYAKLGNANSALTLLDRARPLVQQVQTPNVLRRAWLLQPIAVTYAQAGAFDKAIAVAQAISTTEPAAVYTRDETLAGIAQAYTQANQVDQALKILDSMSNGEIKAKNLARFAGVFGRVGDAGQSQKLFNQAIAIAQTGSTPQQKALVLAQVALQYAQVAESGTVALPAVNLMQDPQIKAQTLIDLAALESHPTRAANLVDQGLQAMQQIPDANDRNIIISSFIESLLRANKFASALQTAQALAAENPFADQYLMVAQIAKQATAAGDLNLSLKAIESIPTNWIDYRNQGFRDIAIAHAQAGRYDQALQLLNRINNFGSFPYQIRARTAIASAMHTRKDTARANTLLQQTLPLINRLESPNQKADGLTALAIQYQKIGQTQQAQQFRSQALKLVQSIPESSDQTFQFRQIVEQYLEAKQFNFAVQFAQAIREESARTQTLNEIAVKLIEAQELEAALQAANGLAKPEDKTRFLVDVANHFVASGNFDRAQRILSQAFDTAKTIPGPESKVVVVRDDLQVDDPFDRASLLEMIALKYAEINQHSRAVQVAQTLQTPSLRTALIQRLSCYRF